MYIKRLRARALPRRPLAAIAGLLIVLFVCPASWGGETVLIDGIPHVRNSDTPSQGRETIVLEETWRVGGDDEEGLLLAVVSEVAGDKSGNVYVMDARLCQVHVFSPSGELLRTMFSEGEGPGESLRPRDLVVTDSGVGLAEEFPAKIIMVDREGLPATNIYLAARDGRDGNMGALTSIDYGGSNLVVSGTEIIRSDTPGKQDRVYFLACIDESGAERFRYCESKSQYNFADFTFIEREHLPNFWWGFAVGSDGTVYAAADRNAYNISVFGPDGALKRVIERDTEPYKRTVDEKQWVRDLVGGALRDMPFEVKMDVEDTEPVIDNLHRGLRVDGDGNLWVTTAHGLRDHTGGAMLTYDVFDPRGNFTRQVAVVCDGNSFYDCLFWVSDDQVVLLTNAIAALVAQFGGGATADADDEEATPQAVVCYTVKR